MRVVPVPISPPPSPSRILRRAGCGCCQPGLPLTLATPDDPDTRPTPTLAETFPLPTPKSPSPVPQPGCAPGCLNQIAYNADAGNLFGSLGHYPAANHSPGTMRDIYDWDSGVYLGQIPEAAQTYNVVGNMVGAGVG